MHQVSGHSRPVSRFRGLHLCMGVYERNACWAHWTFLPQYLEWPLAVNSNGGHDISNTLLFYNRRKKSQTWRLSVVPFPLRNHWDSPCHHSSSFSSFIFISTPVPCVWWPGSQRGLPLWVSLLLSLVMTLAMTEAARAVSCQCLQAPTSVLERSCLTSPSAAPGRISTRSARLSEFQRQVCSKLHKPTLGRGITATAVLKPVVGKHFLQCFWKQSNKCEILVQDNFHAYCFISGNRYKGSYHAQNVKSA